MDEITAIVAKLVVALGVSGWLVVLIVCVSLGLCVVGLVSLRRARAQLATHLAGLESMSESAADRLMRRFGDVASLQRDQLEAVREVVGRKLEHVERGIGEMRSVAADVSDLRRVIGNVKTRGVYGEAQLESLLGEFLTADQYRREFRPRPDREERVDFAVRLRAGAGADAPFYLPIDAKFPQDDYLRLLEARERGDADAADRAARALRRATKREATRIATKYIHPPHTTDFAILFLPSESLHAEILGLGDLAAELHRESRIVLAGPASLAALLSTLQMGFQMQMLEGRSSEVWRALAETREELQRFGDQTERTRRKLHEALRGLDHLDAQARTIDRHLSALAGSATRPDTLDAATRRGGPPEEDAHA